MYNTEVFNPVCTSWVNVRHLARQTYFSPLMHENLKPVKCNSSKKGTFGSMTGYILLVLLMTFSHEERDFMLLWN